MIVSRGRLTSLMLPRHKRRAKAKVETGPFLHFLRGCPGYFDDPGLEISPYKLSDYCHNDRLA